MGFEVLKLLQAFGKQKKPSLEEGAEQKEGEEAEPITVVDYKYALNTNECTAVIILSLLLGK